MEASVWTFQVWKIDVNLPDELFGAELTRRLVAGSSHTPRREMRKLL